MKSIQHAGLITNGINLDIPVLIEMKNRENPYFMGTPAVLIRVNSNDLRGGLGRPYHGFIPVTQAS